ncbi:uncharacterized protein BDR25DRAFT_356792 [Lindgomyces ingoldianus]|uniref:Uncharacterized protein n=1 Tax=Lindgomyces ingoldianus TaxID=673940 RepID=A0ACB6QPX4_9PLEO|nr:uncharacterized protein BDR25DRAFT_356792 [Lindgomyces ingoldianus]KAF2469029.1 hypothetical protein BDR25DRAFT_356792 [Lindgomyces ingoldianus]
MRCPPSQFLKYSSRKPSVRLVQRSGNSFSLCFHDIRYRENESSSLCNSASSLFQCLTFKASSSLFSIMTSPTLMKHVTKATRFLAYDADRSQEPHPAFPPKIFLAATIKVIHNPMAVKIPSKRDRHSRTATRKAIVSIMLSSCMRLYAFPNRNSISCLILLGGKFPCRNIQYDHNCHFATVPFVPSGKRDPTDLYAFPLSKFDLVPSLAFAYVCIKCSVQATSQYLLTLTQAFTNSFETALLTSYAKASRRPRDSKCSVYYSAQLPTEARSCNPSSPSTSFILQLDSLELPMLGPHCRTVPWAAKGLGPNAIHYPYPPTNLESP